MNETLIIINSGQADYGTSADFTYSFKDYGLTGVKQFRVNKITVPYSFYNQRQQNFIIQYNGAGPVNLLFPAGSYTATGLATKLAGIINATIANPITITYDSVLNKFKFTMTGADTLILNFIPGPGGSLANYNIGVQMGLILASSVAAVGPFNALTAPYCANLNATSNIYISSAILNMYNVSYFDRIKANIIQSVPVNVNSFNFIIWENSQQTMFDLMTDNTNISYIDIKILDDYGNVLDLNGLNVIIEIQFYINANN